MSVFNYFKWFCIAFFILSIFGGCIKSIENSNIVRTIYLKQFNNKRPEKNIFSEREIVDLTLKQVFTDKREIVEAELKENPDVKNAEIGDVILVEDRFTPIAHKRNTKSYYYYINAKLKDGSLLAHGTAVARTDSKYAGLISTWSVHSKKDMTVNIISKKEAIDLLKEKYSLENLKEIKAVLVLGPRFSEFEWGWAIKISPTNAKRSGLDNIKTIWVHCKNYKHSEIKSSSVDYYKKLPRIVAFEEDFFDDTINTNKNGSSNNSKPKILGNMYDD